VSTFKFSLSWDTLARDSVSTQLNETALQFYTTVVNEFQNKGIEAHVTLFEETIPEKIKVYAL
jgi:beta-glucosidase/6-phospho-beta-glucosidase/beta-galactosidase